MTMQIRPMVIIKTMPLDLSPREGVLFSFMVGWMAEDGERKERDHTQNPNCFLMRLALLRKRYLRRGWDVGREEWEIPAWER